MIAVVEVGGKQYIVSPNMKIEVDNQNLAIGATLETSPLLVSDEAGTNTVVGVPTVAGAKVIFEVTDAFKADKIRVFKMKSKKRYNRTYGFRAHRTELIVKSISA
jgi:large subunit ribosomal protein L21